MSSADQNGNARLINEINNTIKRPIKMTHLLWVQTDKYIPILTNVEAMELAKNNIPLFNKLKEMRINYDFENVFSEKLNNVRLLKLSRLYNNDMIKIKDHILWDQTNDLLAQMRKGYITVEDL
jgi:hypothetical protein